MDPDKVLSFTLLADRASRPEAQPKEWTLLKDILLDSGQRYAMHAMECGHLKKLYTHYSTSLARWRKTGGSPARMDNGQDGGLMDYLTGGFEEDHKTMGSLHDIHHPKLHRDDLLLPFESDSSDQGAAASPYTTFKSEGTPATVYTSMSQHQDSRGQRSSSEAPTLPSIPEWFQHSSLDGGSKTLAPFKVSSSTATSPTYNQSAGVALRAPHFFAQNYHTTGVNRTRHDMPEPQHRRASVQEVHAKERGQIMSDGRLDAGMPDMAIFISGNDDVPPQSDFQDSIPNWLDQLPVTTTRYLPVTTTRYGLPLDEQPNFFADGNPGC
jgi:hypothetical protein